MKNNSHVIDTIVSKIEQEACYNNPGPTAVAAGKFIDEGYIVIPRAYLPEPQLRNNCDATVGLINEHTLGGDTTAMRRRAYNFLSMADYLDDRNEKERKEKDAKKLNEDRYRVFKTIVPHSEVSLEKFTYETCMISTQNAIKLILDLESQLAK